MSEQTTPTASAQAPVASPSPAAKSSGPGAVIRKLETATETAHERLIKKHLPAWVISGAINIGLVAILLLLGARTPNVKATDKIIDTSGEKPSEDTDPNLTNESPGIQSNLEAFAPELKRLDEATVQSAVTDDNLGTPGANDNDVVSLPPPGLNPTDTNAGATGTEGQAVAGPGGGGGNSFHSFPGRSGATKSQLLREGGGNAESERAVGAGWRGWRGTRSRTAPGFSTAGRSRKSSRPPAWRCSRSSLPERRTRTRAVNTARWSGPASNS